MRIEKWYLDCVTAEGAGMIGYAARISWGALAVRCAETLRWDPAESPVVNRTAFGGPLPVATAGEVCWRSPVVQAEGCWRTPGPCVSTVILHEEPAGRVEWTCCCPSARVEASVEGIRCEGLGYAERLVMTLPPARLPIRELRWGRFIAGAQSCVWIQWRGPIHRTWCFHNAIPVDADRAEAQTITWRGHRLQLEPGRILRSGRIGDTAFKDAGRWRRLLPASIVDVEETKWCCRGILTDAQGRPHAGWAIHEVALFP